MILCTYCGGISETHDHVPPITIAARMTPPRPIKVVPCCYDCNRILGNRPPWTVLGRRREVNKKLQRRHARLLRTPDWTPEELAALGPFLQRTTRARLAKKAAIIERLKWSSANNWVHFTVMKKIDARLLS